MEVAYYFLEPLTIIKLKTLVYNYLYVSVYNFSLSVCNSAFLHICLNRKPFSFMFPEQYIERFPAGASQVAWWIMENRREYFDRSKDVLDRIKMLVFLSESQSKQWQKWCEEESIKLRSRPELVPLSVNDELAFVAGIPSTLNTPSFSTEKMVEKRQLLRDSVRKEMGLTDKDMLVISLSSINPAKGQLLLLESASLVVEHGQLHEDNKMNKSLNVKESRPTLAKRSRIRKLLPLLMDGNSLNRLHEPKYKLLQIIVV